MKTRVIINNDLTTIELTPENDFEKNLIEGFDGYRIKLNSSVRFTTESNYGVKGKHKLLIDLTTSNDPTT